MKKIPYEEFIKTYPNINNNDKETIQVWNNRHKFTFIQQMSDVWGEADKCVNLKNNGESSKLEKQIIVFINTVDAVLTDPKLSKGAREELRSAEWELLDYCIWDNEWKNNDNTAMEWFNQWMFDYNYELR